MRPDAPDIEAIRLDEHLRVAIRRPKRQVKQVPLADRLAAQAQVRSGDPLQELGGAIQSALAVARRRPSALKAMERTTSVCIVQRRRSKPYKRVYTGGGSVGGTRKWGFLGILQGFLVWPLSAGRAQTSGEVLKLAFDASHEGAKLSVGQKRGTREFTALTPKSCS
jgi:hypothetical protein